MNDRVPLLTSKNVVKRYQMADTAIDVLKGVDLELMAGERVAIVGRSGSGKSSLLHVLAGLDEADAGEILMAGESMTGVDNETRTALRGSSMGFVYQQHHLMPEFSALENVALPLRLNGLARKDAEQRSSALLSKVGLEARLGHLPSELSGGERQRVAVARALVHQPKLVMADEPTGNLDDASAQELMALMVELSDAHAVALLVVTHDRSMLGYFDRVLALSEGQLTTVPPGGG
jgi:lipoprotein-releasing system ATP-binding protein